MIRIGSIVLGLTLLSAVISAGWGYWQFQNTQKQLERVENSLKTVRELTVIAGRLRSKGEVEASDKALRKAGLSTLIDNEEVKQVWLLAATTEAYQSAGDKEQNLADDILDKISLDSLNNNKSELNQEILNQVKAFAYLQAGKVKNDKYYQEAYDALKASKFDPFPNNETDLLIDEDVENIHWGLIKSRRIKINSSDEIAISFRQHLYDGLEFLLQKDRVQEADQKTAEIMLYIAGRKEENSFSTREIEDFSCDALLEIDSLWEKSSNSLSRFGFQQQRRIWERNGSPKLGRDLTPIEVWRKFFIDVGWKTKRSGIQEEYKGYEDLIEYVSGIKDLEDMESGGLKQGNLPLKWIQGMWWWKSRGNLRDLEPYLRLVYPLFERIKECDSARSPDL